MRATDKSNTHSCWLYRLLVAAGLLPVYSPRAAVLESDHHLFDLSTARPAGGFSSSSDIVGVWWWWWWWWVKKRRRACLLVFLRFLISLMIIHYI